MLHVLLGMLALTGAAQAEERIVTCQARNGRTELVFEKRGDVDYPLPPKFVSALLGDKAITLEEFAEYGGGREFFFRVPDRGTLRFFVTFGGEFRVERRLFGDPAVVAQGHCDGRP